MTILKIQKEDRSQFVIFSKTVLELPDLSWEAKGLWAYLMSKPKSWEVSVTHLINHFPSGRHRIYKLLNELIENGICSRDQPFVENEKGKKFKGKVETIIYELPQPELLAKIQKKILVPENQIAENQVANLGTQVSKEREISKEKENTPIVPKRDEREACGAVVKLSKEEYQKAEEMCGKEVLKEIISEMNDYCLAHGKKYNDYLAAIRTWYRKRQKEPKKVQATQLQSKQEWAQKIVKMLGPTSRIEAYPEYIIFKGIGAAPDFVFKYSEHGFQEQVINRLRKMGVKIDEKFLNGESFTFEK